jgi:hypothetical protein
MHALHFQCPRLPQSAAAFFVAFIAQIVVGSTVDNHAAIVLDMKLVQD